ncbi:MAG: hypothetical protein HY671_10375 [Chloroflexi bacterium]|nr:hypothetical protein [Chloroflexota bacterium]
MSSDILQKRIGRVSAVVYTSLSLVLAGAFLATSSALDFPGVARYGGTVWVFLLSMIILMPTITPLIKRRLKE